MCGSFCASDLTLLFTHIVLQSRITSSQPFFQRTSIPFEHEMCSVQDMNQFGVMNEDVVGEVNLGIENGVRKSKDSFGKGNDILVCKSDELETGDFAAGTAPEWQERRISSGARKSL